jgi:hypothetical protein
MTDRPDDAAWIAFTEAFAAYLKANGWNPVVVSSARVQQQPGSAKFNYEFVVPFTGTRIKPK